MHGLQWDYSLIPATTRENYKPSDKNVMQKVAGKKLKYENL
jgi:hypothetical protein